ncbi:MAG TPA: class I SAM-dependent methyltransferase [Paenibacillus sp.]|jgi:cyclopropane fatty-acyl-phospholipid synthase-like methyltransferase
MNQANFDEARKAEANYHNELYNDHEILEPGTWMAQPIPIVMELLDRLLQHQDHVTVLDLGCGAGRNTIPLAVRLKETSSKVVGVDLLDEAIEKLRENANKYDVANVIEARKGDAEQVDILKNSYDYIAACGCLEHVSSEEAFLEVLERMKLGTRLGGIHCITMNTEIQEVDRETGRELETLIELNLSTEKAFTIFEKVYAGWNVLDRKTTLLSIDEEKYDKPSQFRCQSITFAVQKIS